MSVGAVNKQTGDRIPTAGMPAIDSVLSGTSMNPVQNRVVKAALDDITDGQNIDSFAEVETALAGKVDVSLVGSANGVAELDANGRVPSSQLPSYVDDVLEYADLAHFPATGETGKIYIAEDTNKTYRWSGSDYAEISESLALGETSSTAYAGNKGKANADAIAAIKDGTNIDSFGDVETALSGKANSSDLGDKSNLTTTDKSSAVAAINEVNWKAGTFGTYTISNATDIRDFIKKLITQADADLASKPAYMLFNIFAVYSNVDVFYGTIERQENHAYAYSLSRAHGNYIYQGYYSITADSLTFYEFMSTNKSATVVSLDPTYDAGTDWTIVKQGNICVLNMGTLKDIPAGNTVVGNIPVGFRPEPNAYEYVYSANKNIHMGVNLYGSGEIQILNLTGVAISGTINFYRNVTYFTA